MRFPSNKITFINFNALKNNLGFYKVIYIIQLMQIKLVIFS